LSTSVTIQSISIEARPEPADDSRGGVALEPRGQYAIMNASLEADSGGNLSRMQARLICAHARRHRQRAARVGSGSGDARRGDERSGAVGAAGRALRAAMKEAIEEGRREGVAAWAEAREAEREAVRKRIETIEAIRLA
jgi:hypothetical protein